MTTMSSRTGSPQPAEGPSTGGRPGESFPVQSLTRRLRTASPRPWPDHPVPIALVITDLDVGGAERAMVNLATRLDRRRWSPLVIALGAEGVLAGVVRRAGLPCECLGADRRRPLQAVARLARALRRHRPELVQSFLFHANVAARLAAPWAGRPWVVGGLRVAEHRKRWHLAARSADRAAGQRLGLRLPRACWNSAGDAGGLDPRRLTVIPNGIDPAPFDRAAPCRARRSGFPRTPTWPWPWAGSTPRRGSPTCWPPPSGSSPPTRPGTWPWRATARAGAGSWISSRPGRCSRAGSTGSGARDDVPGLLKSADVLVLASLWEGMPNVVLEAMAAGRAVVATAVEGTAELVLPGETGWLVPPEDPRGARPGPARSRPGSRRLCRRLGRNGRARIGAEFSLDRTVAAYERLWAGMLGYRWRLTGSRL